MNVLNPDIINLLGCVIFYHIIYIVLSAHQYNSSIIDYLVFLSTADHFIYYCQRQSSGLEVCCLELFPFLNDRRLNFTGIVVRLVIYALTESD